MAEALASDQILTWIALLTKKQKFQSGLEEPLSQGRGSNSCALSGFDQGLTALWALSG